jgi:hypothetical protein
MVQSSLDILFETVKLRLVPLRPMRSTFPCSNSRSGSSAPYSANRMLEKPPFMVRKENNLRISSMLD